MVAPEFVPHPFAGMTPGPPLAGMLSQMTERGPDSTGFALSMQPVYAAIIDATDTPLGVFRGVPYPGRGTYVWTAVGTMGLPPIAPVCQPMP